MYSGRFCFCPACWNLGGLPLNIERIVDTADQSRIDAATRYCAVYGHPVRHSSSPAMQNAGIAAMGLNWRYLAFDVSPEDLKAAMLGARAMRYIGINLTIPHKLRAVEWMDVLDEGARRWGAVNTVCFEGRDAAGEWRGMGEMDLEEVEEVRLHGFNTDADAVVRSLREDLDLDLSGASVLLLGAGGAGRVAALKLAESGVAEIYLRNRTLEKSEALAEEIGGQFPGVRVECGDPEGDVDLVMNATSLGLHPGDRIPWELTGVSLRRCRAVYDMIYRPAESPFLVRAREAGCRVSNGLGMLLYQGVKALELWTGRPAPVEVMRRALRKNIYG